MDDDARAEIKVLERNRLASELQQLALAQSQRPFPVRCWPVALLLAGSFL